MALCQVPVPAQPQCVRASLHCSLLMFVNKHGRPLREVFVYLSNSIFRLIAANLRSQLFFDGIGCIVNCVWIKSFVFRLRLFRNLSKDGL